MSIQIINPFLIKKEICAYCNSGHEVRYEYPYEIFDYHDYSIRLSLIKAPAAGTLEHFFGFFYSKKVIPKEIDYQSDYINELLNKIHIKEIQKFDFYEYMKRFKIPEYMQICAKEFCGKNIIASYQIYEPFATNVDSFEGCWIIITKNEFIILYFEISEYPLSY